MGTVGAYQRWKWTKEREEREEREERKDSEEREGWEIPQKAGS